MGTTYGTEYTWKCDACKHDNDVTHNICQKCICEKLAIPIMITDHHFNSKKFTISTSYSYLIRMQDVLTKTRQTINRHEYPKVYYIESVSDKSFIQKQIWHSNNKEWNDLCAIPLNNYNISNITTRGLHIKIAIKYKHRINKHYKICKYIQNKSAETKENSDNQHKPLQCPIYQSMKVQYKFSQKGLQHLQEFAHFEDEFNDKPTCKYDQNCKAFIRVQHGGNRLDDQCHAKLYKHAPRTNRQIKLSQNIAEFLVNTDIQQNHPVYKPTFEDAAKYDVTDYEFIVPVSDENIVCTSQDNGYIEALIQEVMKNGYKSDLCVECKDDCKHNNYSLLKIVDQKMKHIRHQQMDKPLRRDHMLALILYTGCDCNYDLCKSQRNNDYNKWKWFDYCLYNAIKLLSDKEAGTYKLYSGLHGVKLAKKQILKAYFPTYTSASWDKTEATKFMGDKGMMIEIDKQVRNSFVCCDVSWISKFEHECEILIARSGAHWSDNKFAVSIVDESNEIQTVLLTNKK